MSEPRYCTDSAAQVVRGVTDKTGDGEVSDFFDVGVLLNVLPTNPFNRRAKQACGHPGWRDGEGMHAGCVCSKHKTKHTFESDTSASNCKIELSTPILLATLRKNQS